MDQVINDLIYFFHTILLLQCCHSVFSFCAFSLWFLWWFLVGEISNVAQAILKQVLGNKHVEELICKEAVITVIFSSLMRFVSRLWLPPEACPQAPENPIAYSTASDHLLEHICSLWSSLVACPVVFIISCCMSEVYIESCSVTFTVYYVILWWCQGPHLTFPIWGKLTISVPEDAWGHAVCREQMRKKMWWCQIPQWLYKPLT